MQNLHIHRVRSGFLVAFLILSYLIQKDKTNTIYFFETFVCIMATCKSQIIYGLRDRQKFSRAKKPLQLQTLKERSKYR